MRKKIIIIAVCFALVLLVLPMKYRYKDGGTVEYKAVLYNVIKWHALDNNYDEGYKTGTEVHFFPANLRRIDYYMNNTPQRMELHYNNEKYYASTLDYNWCNEYENCTSREVLLVKDIGYDDAIRVKTNENISLLLPAKIQSVVIYKGTLDNIYAQEIEFTEDYIKTPDATGDFVYILHCKNGNNIVNYLFKLIVD